MMTPEDALFHLRVAVKYPTATVHRGDLYEALAVLDKLVKNASAPIEPKPVAPPARCPAYHQAKGSENRWPCELEVGHLGWHETSIMGHSPVHFDQGQWPCTPPLRLHEVEL